MTGLTTRTERAPRRRGLVASFGAYAGLALLLATLSGGEALAQSAECARLQQAIAARHGSSGASAAADRQRAELARASAQARSLGCENRKFLFFGSDPPAQCGELNGQIARMQANLADLQARANGGAGDLIARYNAECSGGGPKPTNVFEALFGGLARLGAPQQDMQGGEEPIDRGDSPVTNDQGQSEGGGVNAHAGSYAVCVKTCDGSFFPVSYSGAGSRADSLEEVCRALCPNADVALYSFPFGGTINEAMSAGGEPYANLPNAGKFQTSNDPTCSCRRKGQSWADALADAEARYGHEKHDILVTQAISAEMARPIVDPKTKPAADAKAKDAAATASPAATGASATNAPATGLTPPSDTPTAPVLDANGADTKLSAAAATVSREASGIAGGDTDSTANYSLNQGKTVEALGPDGTKRRVRIVGPTL